MIKYSVIFCFAALFCVNIGMLIIQRQLIYVPSSTIPNRTTAHADDMKIITLHTQDGLNLMSWYKPAYTHQPTVLILHGNAGNIATRMTLARSLMDAGLGVLLLEYRGYGGNPGQPTEQGFYQDARAAMNFLHQQSIQNKDIILYGESLGTGVATKLATEYKVAAVILQSPYTSLTALGRYHYPWIFIKPWDKFDSLSRITQISSPLLILHGKKDTLVPYQQGLQLFNAAHQQKFMISYPQKGHHRLWEAPGLMHEVIEFIHNTNQKNQ